MRTNIYPADPEACDAALPVGGADRRRGSARHDDLSVEELALIASCGERIRESDWSAIRRAEQAAVRQRIARST